MYICMGRVCVSINAESIHAKESCICVYMNGICAYMNWSCVLEYEGREYECREAIYVYM